MLAYAAPAAGLYFFSIPMWTILPGVYAKHFGLTLSSLATVILTVRIFDGFITPIIGYLSDWHRSRGGSRKPWVIAGGAGVAIACYFLYIPQQPVTVAYYLTWSIAYFCAHSAAEIAHATWGSELTMDYQRRAVVFGTRTVMVNLGFILFYALPLLPLFSSSGYTPEELKAAAVLGAIVTAVGLAWAFLSAPSGYGVRGVRGDSALFLFQTIVSNRPLLIYYAAFGCIGICYGMWFGLLFLYLDTYLGLGDKVALIFLGATIVSVALTPVTLKLIEKFGKAPVWAGGGALFVAQLAGTWFVAPGMWWMIPFALIVVAHLCFASQNVAAMSLLGDISDYGKLKFRKDRGAMYFGCNLLVFQFSFGLGGGSALAIAGWFGFDPMSATHAASHVLGLKLAFIALPMCLGIASILPILLTPLDRRRHRIIQRRLESRLATELVRDRGFHRS